MKVLDVSSLHEGIRGMTQQLSQLEKQLNGVENSIRSFVASKDSFRGQGANAIRRFYEYAHLPFLQFFQTFLANFQSKLQQLQFEMDGLEGDSRGFIDESFLSSELEDGLNQINRMVAELTGETNVQLSRVSDIVYLPRLHDHQFHEGIQQAKQSARQTVDKLHQFDHQQTQSFTALVEDLSLIRRYIEEMSQQFESGKINVKNFSPVMLQDLEAYGKLQTRLYNQTVMERWNSEHYPELGVFYPVGHAAAFDQFVNPSCARPEPKIRSLDEVALDFSLGLRDGAFKFLKETKDGIVRLVTEPEVILQETVAFAGEVVRNPAIIGEIAKELYQTFDTMVIHGDAESRGEWFGYALPTVGSIFVGGTGAVKGAGKVIQVGRKTQTDLDIKLKDKQENPTPIAIGPQNKSMDRVRELMDNFSFRRDLEPVPIMAGDVPFNAFNSMNIMASLKKIQSQTLIRIEAIGYGKGSGKEYKNYKAVEYNGNTRINGEVRDTSRRVYQRKDIDYDRVDPKTGKTNYQLMKSGKPPIWQDGTKIELHHLIQREPGSMVELPSSMHKEYDRILHGLVENGGSFRNDPVLKKQYENFRSKYWRWRAKQIDKGEL